MNKICCNLYRKMYCLKFCRRLPKLCRILRWDTGEIVHCNAQLIQFYALFGIMKPFSSILHIPVECKGFLCHTCMHYVCDTDSTSKGNASPQGNRQHRRKTLCRSPRPPPRMAIEGVSVKMSKAIHCLCYKKLSGTQYTNWTFACLMNLVHWYKTVTSLLRQSLRFEKVPTAPALPVIDNAEPAERLYPTFETMQDAGSDFRLTEIRNLKRRREYERDGRAKLHVYKKYRRCIIICWCGHALHNYSRTCLWAGRHCR